MIYGSPFSTLFWTAVVVLGLMLGAIIELRVPA